MSEGVVNTEYYREQRERPELYTILRRLQAAQPNGHGATLRILDVGCGAGGLVRRLREDFSQAIFDGVEVNADACREARPGFDRLFTGSIEDYLATEIQPRVYDYIILADILEHLIDPWDILSQLLQGLKPEGRLVASLPNVGNYTVIYYLLQGRWEYMEGGGLLDKTHLRFFTLKDAQDMLQKAGYQVDEIRATRSPHHELIDRMADFVATLGGDPEQFRQETQVFQYIFIASPALTVLL